MALYAADGSINVTVVDGTTRTGLYAADGSWNVVVSDGIAHAGVYHPCGAYWVTVLEDGPEGIYATDGSLYVQESPYTYTGGLRVTVVSGNLGFSLTAPVLTLLSAADDNTPLWGFDLISPQADDVIRIEWDDAIPYVAQVSFSDYTITAGDLSGDFEFAFGLPQFANGDWSWRAYHMRGASSSDVSNTVTETLTGFVNGAFFAPRYFPNRYFAERYFG